jgi:tetratricopeptide (TPR) repeat protein
VNHESDSAFEFLRHRAGIDLTPHQQAEFQKLTKILRFGSRFQFLFVEIANPSVRDRLIARLTEALELAHEHSVRIDLSAGTIADVAALEQTLREESARGAKIIHIVNADLWLNEDRLQTLNMRRESLAHALTCRLAFWLPTAVLERVASRAADLWSWRSGIYSLVDSEHDVAVSSPPQVRQIGPNQPPQNLSERAKRIPVLRQWLTQTADEEIQLPLIDELATLLADMGETDEAIDLRRNKELPIYRKLGDERGEAIAESQIADILCARGELDEAFDIYSNKSLPVFQKLGDEREEAIAQGRIADIFHLQGKLDEALDIHRNKELPVFQKLGDEREEAVSQGKIADILYVRRQFDEALDIRRNKELPVYRKLGDARGEAITEGKIADILYALGQFDEALDIRRYKELPVFQKIGDVRLETIAQGQIADILHVRGQLDEALDIRRNKELPVYRKLGDVRGAAVTSINIAEILRDRGQLDEALETLRKSLAVFDSIGYAREATHTRSRIAAIEKELSNAPPNESA